MKEDRLLRCIGSIDNELILEADTTRFPRRHWGSVLALAACLILVIALPVRLLSPGRSGSHGQEEYCGTPLSPYLVRDEGILFQQYDFATETWQATTIDEAAAMPLADLMYEGEDLDSLGEMPATTPTDVLDFRNGTYVILYGGDIAVIQHYETPFETPPLHGGAPAAEAQSTLRRRIPGLDDAVQLALAKSGGINLGGLRPGMTQEEVTALVGEPVLIKEAEQTWFYGSYYVVFNGPNETAACIYTGGGCTLTLNTGIGLGSTAEDVEAVYPDYIPGISTDAVSYHMTANGTDLMIETQNGIVTAIYLFSSQTSISLGGLRLGMTQEEAAALLGEPASVKDGENIWLYEDLTLEFSSFNGQLVKLLAQPGCGLALNSGVGFGSTQEAVTQAYPAAYSLPGDPETEKVDVWYWVEGDGFSLQIGTANGTVGRIILDTSGDPLLNALTVNELTLYAAASEGWLVVDITDKAAKRICTTLTISEPEPVTPPEYAATDWLDFGSGTAVGWFGNDYAAVCRYAGTFDPDTAADLQPHLQGVFSGLDDAILQAMANPNETWETEP